MQIKAGDIVFVNYPFTDSSQSKQRPAVIVSFDENFIWALPVTSSDSRGNYDNFLYEFSTNDLVIQLPNKSCVRCNVIMTFDRKQVTKVVTSVKAEAYERIYDLAHGFMLKGKPQI